jgi:hypothetical protein
MLTGSWRQEKGRWCLSIQAAKTHWGFGSNIRGICLEKWLVTVSFWHIQISEWYSPTPRWKGAGQICDLCCHVVIECKWGRAKVARDYMTWPVCKFQKILQFWNCVDRGSKLLTVEMTCSKWITEWILQYVIVIRSNQIVLSSCQRSATWDSRISQKWVWPTWM